MALGILKILQFILSSSPISYKSVNLNEMTNMTVRDFLLYYEVSWKSNSTPHKGLKRRNFRHLNIHIKTCYKKLTINFRIMILKFSFPGLAFLAWVLALIWCCLTPVWHRQTSFQFQWLAFSYNSGLRFLLSIQHDSTSTLPSTLWEYLIIGRKSIDRMDVPQHRKLVVFKFPNIVFSKFQLILLKFFLKTEPDVSIFSLIISLKL